MSGNTIVSWRGSSSVVTRNSNLSGPITSSNNSSKNTGVVGNNSSSSDDGSSSSDESDGGSKKSIVRQMKDKNKNKKKDKFVFAKKKSPKSSSFSSKDKIIGKNGKVDIEKLKDYNKKTRKQLNPLNFEQAMSNFSDHFKNLAELVKEKGSDPDNYRGDLVSRINFNSYLIDLYNDIIKMDEFFTNAVNKTGIYDNNITPDRDASFEDLDSFFLNYGIIVISTKTNEVKEYDPRSKTLRQCPYAILIKSGSETYMNLSIKNNTGYLEEDLEIPDGSPKFVKKVSLMKPDGTPYEKVVYYRGRIYPCLDQARSGLDIPILQSLENIEKIPEIKTFLGLNNNQKNQKPADPNNPNTAGKPVEPGKAIPSDVLGKLKGLITAGNIKAVDINSTLKNISWYKDKTKNTELKKELGALFEGKEIINSKGEKIKYEGKDNRGKINGELFK